MENLKDVIDIPQKSEIGDNPPTSMWLSDAASITNGNLHIPDYVYEYKRGAVTRFTTGVIEGIEAIEAVPEQVQIIGGQAQVALGGYWDDQEMIKRGQMNISTAQRNLDAALMERYRYSSPEETGSFAYTLGGGAVNYGTMVLGGGLGTAAKVLGSGTKVAGVLATTGSLGTMGAMEAGQEAYERTSKYLADTGNEDFSGYTPEKAKQNLLAEAAYTAGSVTLEHMIGFGAQKKIWKLDLKKAGLPSAFRRATIDTVRSGAITAASETTTEIAQSFLNIGIDLADGTMNMAEVPERIQQEMVGWAAASVIGGTAGISAAISHRANGLKYIKQQISDVVPPEDLNSVANLIFDTGANAVADKVSVELELSSELQNKHGAVYDSMQRAIKRAADESGAFKNISEDEMAEYVSDTAKLFADQVLAEANQRNVNIDDVLKASDIVYEDGGIRLKNKSEETTIGQEMYQLPVAAYDKQGKADINSEAFKRWFGDSKVVDEKGKPLVVYHGTNTEFDTFDKEKIKRGTGFWFSSNKETSKEYGDIKEFYLSVKNPIDVNKNRSDFIGFAKEAIPEIPNDVSEHYIITDALSSVIFKEYLQKKGYDAISLGDSYIVFEPNQIKSINNYGTFDPSNDNIYYQEQTAGNVVTMPTIEEFNNPVKDYELPRLNESDLRKLGKEDKPVVLKKNIIEKNKRNHPEVDISEYDKILTDTLINTSEIIQVQPQKKPNYYTFINENQNDISVVELSENKDNYEVINFFKVNKKRIDEYRKKAVKDGGDIIITERKPQGAARLSALLNSDINNITPTRENVNKTLYQKRPNPKGSFDTKTGLVKIFETADFSTLPHELAHYWLDNMWNYTRSGNASEQYLQRWNVISNWLNIRPEQTRLTRGQQEKFARGYEQYLLNGNLPTPMIKGAFDDYDRWLKRVYGDMNRLNVRLTDDAVRFFQSMTSGNLPAPKLKPLKKKKDKMTFAEKLREKMNIQQQEMQEQEAVKLVEDVEAARQMPDNVIERTVISSNITDGDTGASRVYEREIGKNVETLTEIADADLEYRKINLAEQAKKADEFVRNNLDEARKIVDGLKPAPENILDTAIRISYEQEMLRIGNNEEYLRALKLHSSLQTLRGQEISAEKITAKDVTSPEYWINKVVANRTYRAAQKMFGGWKSLGENSLDLYKKMIKDETGAISNRVLAEKTPEGQKRVLNEEIERLKREYDIDNDQLELFQMPTDQVLNNRNVKMYINGALDNLFGATVSQEEANQIIGKIDELSRSIANTFDTTGNPSVQTWVKINEINNLVESLTPSPALQVTTSIVGRAMMLASVKSPVLNIISNTENILAEMIIRRAVNTIEGGATQSAVDRQVISEYLKYADDVYKASGYNVSTTQDMDATTVTLGEQRISTQGEGRFRKFSRAVETGVFKYLMGYPDSVSKDIVFSDVASLEATTIAINEGREGKALTDRATELFRDAARVEPITEEGQIIRDKAIKEANIATYTNNTALSKLALGIREALNQATGNVRLGDQLMPFVKTPANVVSLGLEYTAGLAYALPKLPKIIKDIKSGSITSESRTAIKAAIRNGLGVVLAMLVAMSFDPEDYTPEYDALSPSERKLALEKGAVFNSIRIGNKYISLDYFGPVAVPLSAVLTSRYRKDNPLWGFAAGALSQAAKTPGVGEISDAIKFIGDSVRRDARDNVENIGNIMLDYVRARTIPSFVNDLAKSFDSVERETSGGTFDRLMSTIPGLRETLPEKYSTTSAVPRKTEPALSTILFGARVKTANDNRVIYEIDRLYKSGNRVTITDVTRSGKLSELSENKQQKARKEFAHKYYDAVYKLISSRSYRRKDDEQKANALNKARRKIIESLKRELIK
nr:MAG TPA: hypothetical protein [Caudoviricetes sp.]